MRTGSIRLLDVEPDLAVGLDPERASQAHRMLALAAVDVDAGAVRMDALKELETVRGVITGALVVDGLLLEELQFSGRACTRLHAPGDVIAPRLDPGPTLPTETRLIAMRPSRVAILDERLLAAAAYWPSIVARLYRRAAEQTQRAFLNQAVAQLPRIEDRLLAAFWCLAERWGRVGPDGVVIELWLTHDALGQIVGARRPTVTLGLRALHRSGLLRRDARRRWILAAGSLDDLGHAGDARLDALSPGAPTPAADRS